MGAVSLKTGNIKVMRCVPSVSKAFINVTNSMQLRLSHENPEIIKLYEEFYGEPLSELAEQMLHTVYFDRSADLGGVYIAPTEIQSAAGLKQFRCKVCGYIYEGAILPEDYTCPTCGVGAEMFEEVR